MWSPVCSIWLFGLLHLATIVVAKCECGYYIKQTGSRFTHFLQNDFSQFPDTTSAKSVSNSLSDWDVQDWSTDPDPANGIPLAKQNDPDNVWLKDGQLHLRQKGHAENDTAPVSGAELHSKSTDFLHGSFRMMYNVQVDSSATGGAVAGFFFYYNDTCETDIEILSNDNATTIHYTNHPSVYSNGSSIAGATFQDKLEHPWTQYHEQRFDWVPGLTSFYQTNSLKQEIRQNVPNHNGTIILNVWSDGGSWSGKPSTEDTIVSIKYIIMYYNTSLSDAGQDTTFNTACERAGGLKNRSALCTVDDRAGVTSSASSLPFKSAYCTATLVAVFGGVLIHFQ